MKKIIRQALHLNSLRKIFGWQVLYLAVKSQLHFKVLSNPPKGKVLILSPHPDDDVIACGGTIIKHLRQGDELKIIYLCNGGEGKTDSQRDLIAERKNEALQAIRILGLSQKSVEFWGYQDGKLNVERKIVHRLANQIQNLAPKIIYAPHLSDNHPDHEATALILGESLRLLPKSLQDNIFIWGFEVWQPTFANRLIKINNVIDLKIQAVEVHRSQTKDRPYATAISSLNSYRGNIFGLNSPAEGFLALPSKLYIKLSHLR